MQVTSDFAPGSSQAIQFEDNLDNLLNQGTIANMGITSHTLSTNGGSNNNGGDDDSGLSTRDIIILAVCIPVGVIRTSFFI